MSRVLTEVYSRSTDTEREFGSLLSLREKIDGNNNTVVIGFACLNAFSGTIQCGTISDDDSRVSLEGLLTQSYPAGKASGFMKHRVVQRGIYINE